MAARFDALTHLSERELLDHFERLVARDRRTTVDLLVAIAEIDERKIWAKHACSSMFTFCMKRFHMSEQVTGKRLRAARIARRYPIVLDMIARGELHLSAIQRLSGHLTRDNHVELLERAKHKSARAVERLVAELAPRPDAPSRIRALPRRPAWAGSPAVGPANPGRTAPAQNDAIRNDSASMERDAPATSPATAASGHGQRAASPDIDTGASPGDRRPPSAPPPRPATSSIVPLSPRRYKIEITVDEATHDKLRSLQDLLGRSETGRDPAAILARAIDVLLVETLKRKAAQTDRPRPATNVAAAGVAATNVAAAGAAAAGDGRRARGIPAAVRREVWRRDCGRCRYVDGQGRRCNETRNVEFHHRIAFARGGRHAPDNIELRCPAHNQYQADLDFGRSFMDDKRRIPASAPTDPRSARIVATGDTDDEGGSPRPPAP